MGIDLGTSNCCVAVYKDGRPVTLEYAYERRTSPSTVTVKDGVWHVGRHPITDIPGKSTFLYNAKRVLGRDERDPGLSSDLKNLPYELHEGRPVANIDGTVVELEEISALHLLNAGKVAAAYYGKPAEYCVITVPAHFTNTQRQATRDSALIAGLKLRRLVPEPTAAAVAYLSDSGEDGTYLVVDFGGGTLDATLLNKTTSRGKTTFVVKATAGDNALGGIDFVDVIAELVLPQIGPGITKAAILPACERAKTAMTDGPLEVEFSGEDYSIKRSEYLDRCQHLFDRVKSVVTEALKACPEHEELKGLIFVGGSCYSPAIQQLVRDIVPNVPCLPQRALSELVAQGAAIMAARSDVVVTDVLSRSLGIMSQDGDVDGLMSTLIPRNTPIPYHAEEVFFTNGAQTTIALYEGEEEMADDNILLDEYDIDTSEAQYIKVVIGVDIESTVTVRAFRSDEGDDVSSDEESSDQMLGELTVVRRTRFNEQQIREMRGRAQARFGKKRQSDQSKEGNAKRVKVE